MRRIACTAGLILLAVAWVGCSMCKSPYDYCGPVPGAGGPGRVGSAISGGGPPMYQAQAPVGTSAPPSGTPTEATTTR